MSFPRFLIGMLGVLATFAIVTYVSTQSLTSTLVQTLICAILIQIGYFAVVFFLVMVSRASNVDTVAAADVAPQSAAEERQSAEPLASIGRPRGL